MKKISKMILSLVLGIMSLTLASAWVPPLEFTINKPLAVTYKGNMVCQSGTVADLQDNDNNYLDIKSSYGPGSNYIILDFQNRYYNHKMYIQWITSDPDMVVSIKNHDGMTIQNDMNNLSPGTYSIEFEYSEYLKSVWLVFDNCDTNTVIQIDYMWLSYQS